jgi:hypothetical protein
MVEHLRIFAGQDPGALKSVETVFARDFVRAFVRELVPELGPDFDRDFGRSFGRSFGLAFHIRFSDDGYSSSGGDCSLNFATDFYKAFRRAVGHEVGRGFVRDVGLNFIRDLARLLGHNSEAPESKVELTRARPRKKTFRSLLKDPDLSWETFFSVGVVKDNATTACESVVSQLCKPSRLPYLMMNVWKSALLNRFFAWTRHLALVNLSEMSTNWIPHHPFEVFTVALTWEAHAKEYTAGMKRLSGIAGVLFLSHAAYTNLMTGLVCAGPSQPVWQQLLDERDSRDPWIRFSHLLYEICRFTDPARVQGEMNEFLNNCPPECHDVLEAADWLEKGCSRVRFGL